ncbi:MAG: hypothetical protein PHU25_19110 [Deltaproteobacteria bacterium]|nr:hypothetical protein [Deltaproteobacteria bacterium]
MLRDMVIVGILGAGLCPGVLFCAETQPPDRTLHTDETTSARLVKTLDVTVPYGSDENSLGFVPAGDEHEALGPNAFEVKNASTFMVNDIARHKFFSVRLGSGGRAAVTVVSASIPWRQLEPRMDASGVRVVKTGAETGEIVFGSGAGERHVAIEAGGPLASLNLIGVDDAGRAFVLVERFRQVGRTEIDREVMVLDRQGALVTRLAITDIPAIPMLREFFLAEDGALYRMAPGVAAVRFTRFEVRP